MTREAQGPPRLDAEKLKIKTGLVVEIRKAMRTLRLNQQAADEPHYGGPERLRRRRRRGRHAWSRHESAKKVGGQAASEELFQ
jgi:hypothetical protein